MNWCKLNGLFWFRLWPNGPGFMVKDAADYPLVFSERYCLGFQIGVAGYLIKYLKPFHLGKRAE